MDKYLAKFGPTPKAALPGAWSIRDKVDETLAWRALFDHLAGTGSAVKDISARNSVPLDAVVLNLLTETVGVRFGLTAPDPDVFTARAARMLTVTPRVAVLTTEALLDDYESVVPEHVGLWFLDHLTGNLVVHREPETVSENLARGAMLETMTFAEMATIAPVKDLPNGERFAATEAHYADLEPIEVSGIIRDTLMETTPGVDDMRAISVEWAPLINIVKPHGPEVERIMTWLDKEF